MEKFFYFTGVTICMCIAVILLIWAIGTLYQKINSTIIGHWFSCMYMRATTDMRNLKPITKQAKDNIQMRLDTLKDRNIRKFEQKFLIKYLANAKVKKQETVFDN